MHFWQTQVNKNTKIKKAKKKKKRKNTHRYTPNLDQVVSKMCKVNLSTSDFAKTYHHLMK